MTPVQEQYIDEQAVLVVDSLNKAFGESKFVSPTTFGMAAFGRWSLFKHHFANNLVEAQKKFITAVHGKAYANIISVYQSDSLLKQIKIGFETQKVRQAGFM